MTFVAKLSERYAYGSLWNGLSVSVAPDQVAALESIPLLPPFMSTTGGSLTTWIVTVTVGLFESDVPSLTLKPTVRSVASILGLCATVVPVLSVLHGWNVALASVVAVAIGVCAGAVNGVLVVYAGVNTIVVTLGMMTLLSGIALAIAHLSAVSGLSSSFGQLALAGVGGLPVSFYYGIALALIFAYVLAFTPLGRHMQFVGANREVSRLAGVRVNRIRFGAFVAAGTLCGIGGVVISAGLGGFDPSTSVTYLLPTVSAVFLGTAAVRTGRFNPLGTLIGVYFLATGILGLEELGLAGWISDVFYGAALIVAVLLTTLLRRRASA